MTLFRQYFRAQLSGLIIWAALTGLVTAFIARTARSLAGPGLEAMLARFPEALMKMLGYAPGLGAVDAYVAMELGQWGALLLTLYAVVVSLGVVTREVDRRTIDFLLAQPVTRRQIMLARIPVVMVNTALLAAVMWTALWAVLTAAGLEASHGRIALLFLHHWLLAMAMGGLALLSSVWIDDYSFATKLWLGLVSVAFFLEFMLRAGGLSREVRFFSPFSYVDAVRVMEQGLALTDAVVLAVVALAAFGLSIPAFVRKEIAV